MSEGKYNTLIINEKNYTNGYTVNNDAYQKAIGEAILMLMQNDYIAVVKQECGDFTIIEYQYANQEYGTAYPYWLSYEESETVVYDDERNSVNE